MNNPRGKYCDTLADTAIKLIFQVSQQVSQHIAEQECRRIFALKQSFYQRQDIATWCQLFKTLNSESLKQTTTTKTTTKQQKQLKINEKVLDCQKKDGVLTLANRNERRCHC